MVSIKLCRLQHPRDSGSQVGSPRMLRTHFPSTLLRQKLFYPFNIHCYAYNLEIWASCRDLQLAGSCSRSQQALGAQGGSGVFWSLQNCDVSLGHTKWFIREKLKWVQNVFHLPFGSPIFILPGMFKLWSFYSDSTSGEKRFWSAGIPLDSLFSCPSYIRVTQKRCWTSGCEIEMGSVAAQLP